MNKNILLILLFLSLSIKSFSQNAIAKIKYEDAELNFSNQNYAKALLTLEEVESLLGRKTPKVSHLKIMAGSKIIEANPYNDFELIKRIIDEATFFLNEYGDLADYEEKYKEVYHVFEKLKKYPNTKEEFTQKQKQVEKEKKEAIERELKRIEEENEQRRKEIENNKKLAIQRRKEILFNSRRKCTAWMFNYNLSNSFGVGAGSGFYMIRPKTVGLYFSFLGNYSLPYKSVEYVIGPTEEIYNVRNLCGQLGITFPLSRSFTVNLGVGAGDNYDIVKFNNDPRYYYVESSSDPNYTLEAGFLYQVGKSFFINSNINFKGFLQSPQLSVGIGFAVRKDSDKLRDAIELKQLSRVIN